MARPSASAQACKCTHESLSAYESSACNEMADVTANCLQTCLPPRKPDLITDVEVLVGGQVLHAITVYGSCVLMLQAVPPHCKYVVEYRLRSCIIVKQE